MTYKNKVKEFLNDDQKFANMEKYVFMIEEKNKVMNLTGFKGDDLWREGIYESLVSLTDFITDGMTVLDIGAGAGFPSIPNLIANPTVKLSIHEPIEKRVKFLNEVANELGLSIDIQNIRTEESNEENKYDLVTARAVAKLQALIEIAHRPANILGKFAWIKGPSGLEEIEEADRILRTLGAKVEVKSILIKGKETLIITYEKSKETPKGIPRKWVDIKKEIS